MPIVSKQQLISRGIADATTGVGRRGIRNSRSSRMGVWRSSRRGMEHFATWDYTYTISAGK